MADDDKEPDKLEGLARQLGAISAAEQETSRRVPPWIASVEPTNPLQRAIKRHFAERDKQSGQSSEQPSLAEPEPRRAFSMSRDDAIFWVGLACFGSGASLIFDHPFVGGPLTAAGIVALTWSNRGHMPKPPIRLAALILAMAITCGIAGYDFYDRHFVSQPIPKPTPTAGVGFAEATMPTTKQPSERLLKNYLPAEKVKLAELLSNIRAELNGSGVKAAEQGWRYGNEIPAQKEDIEKLTEQVMATSQLVFTMWDHIAHGIIEQNSFYSDDLLTVISDRSPLTNFASTLARFSRELTIFYARYNNFSDDDRRWVAGLIRKFADDAHYTSDDFKGWIQQCNSRIDAKGAALK